MTDYVNFSEEKRWLYGDSFGYPFAFEKTGAKTFDLSTTEGHSDADSFLEKCLDGDNVAAYVAITSHSEYERYCTFYRRNGQPILCFDNDEADEHEYELFSYTSSLRGMLGGEKEVRILPGKVTEPGERKKIMLAAENRFVLGYRPYSLPFEWESGSKVFYCNEDGLAAASDYISECRCRDREHRSALVTAHGRHGDVSYVFYASILTGYCLCFNKVEAEAVLDEIFWENTNPEEYNVVEYESTDIRNNIPHLDECHSLSIRSGKVIDYDQEE